MAYAVRVRLTSSTSPVQGSPVENRDKAERQVDTLRAPLGTDEKPVIPGLAIIGNDIVSADVVAVTESGAEPFYDLALVEKAIPMAEEVIRAEEARERDD